MDYREAGVDVAAGQAFVRQIRSLVEGTYRREVLGGLGGFSGLFQLPGGYREPVLVSGTDGVGTKLKVAQQGDRHDTVGMDLVAMCVNDVLTVGAEPLFFLDYVATGQLEPEVLIQVVAGIAAGCQESGCALLGGETAEMPGFYAPGDYDLAGFCVGIVEKQDMVTADRVQIGDVALGLASRGVHSNGFSLVRRIVTDQGIPWDRAFGELLRESSHDSIIAPVESLPSTHSSANSSASPSPNPSESSLGEVLLTPTQIYVKPVLGALKAGLSIHGMAHITGGGLPENLPRCVQPDQSIALNPQQWPLPSVFQWIAAAGKVSPAEMYKTFNMGLGYVLIVPPDSVERAIAHFESHHIPAYPVGEVVRGDNTVLGLPD